MAVLLLAATVGCESLPANTGRTASQALATPEATALGKFVAERRVQAGARSDSGFVLLDSADVALGARLALVDAAQATLDLQYYAIHADASSELILQRVRDAARRGVRVRVLLDDFNSIGKDAQVLRLGFEPNVQMRLFNPLPGSRSSLLGHVFSSLKDLDQIQKRMHNKQFIADNALGISGGRNLGDAYFGSDDASNFVDMDVLSAGRVVRDMSASFDRYWNDDLAFPVEKLITSEQLEAMRKPAPATAERVDLTPSGAVAVSLPASAPNPNAVMKDISASAVRTAAPTPVDLRSFSFTWAPAILLADKPGKIGPDDDEANGGETVVDGLLTLMEGARKDVLIVSPYFVPGKDMMRTFAKMRGNGVRVRVLTNSLASNDAPAAHAGYARYRKDLIDSGVELYEMRADQAGGGGLAVSSGLTGSGSGSSGGSGSGTGSRGGSSRASLHSKLVIVDSRIAIIGSMNLDLRSQRQNSEVALVIRSGAVAQRAIGKVDATVSKGAYRVMADGGALVWRAPAGAPFKDEHDEPDATTKQKLLVRLIGPFAPDEML